MKSPINNQQLVNRFKNGDHKALEVVFKRHYRALWQFAYSMIGNNLEAEDIVTETFLKLWKLKENFYSDINIQAFLYISARNACLNYLRHVAVKRNSLKELMYLIDERVEADFEHMIDIESNLLSEIIGEIKYLPPKMQEIVELTLMNQSTNEISAKLNIAHSTIRVQKARAVKALRMALLKKGLSYIFSVVFTFHLLNFNKFF